MPVATTSATASVEVPYASGTVLRADGTPASGVSVALSSLYADSGSQMSEVVGSTVTDASGRWAIEPSRVPTKPSLAMEVSANVDGAILFYDYEPTITDSQPTSKLGRRSLSLAELAKADDGMPVRVSMRVGRSPRLLAPTAGQAKSAGLSKAAVAAAADDEVVDLPPEGGAEDAVDDTGPDDSRSPLDPTAGPPPPPTCRCWWQGTGTYKRVYDPVRWTQTQGHSVIHYNWTTTKFTLNETALKIGAGGWASAGFATSYKNEGSTGMTPDWPHNTAKIEKVGWKWQKYRLWDVSGISPHVPAEYKWYPYQPTLFSKGLAAPPSFKCDSIGPVNAKTTAKRESTVTFGGWFSIEGFYLDNKQGQNDQITLVMDPDQGETAKYCIQGADTAFQAVQARELPKG